MIKSEQKPIDKGESSAKSNGIWDAEVPSAYPAKYSNEYRHFDILIWQTPVLSSAILALTLSALSDIGSDQPLTGVLLLLIVSFILCSIYYILSRWRIHQQYTKRSNAPGLPNRQKKDTSGEPKKKRGGQFYLQLSTGLLSTLSIGLFFHFLFFNVPCLNTLFIESFFLIILGVLLITVLGYFTWKVEKEVAFHQAISKKLKTDYLAIKKIKKTQENH